MKYRIGDVARAHLNMHFAKDAGAGSRFNEHVLPNIEALLDLLETRDPIEVIKQSGGREAHVYYLSDAEACGWLGIGVRADYPKSLISQEWRNGFLTDFIQLDMLPPTKHVTVVCSTEKKPYELVTAFPGEYAPAFPHLGMTRDEEEKASMFWEKHILLKGNN